MAIDPVPDTLPAPATGPTLRQWRALKAYTLVSTTVFGLLAVTAFTRSSKPQRFQEIDVERINVVEKNGKLRMVISNAERSYGWVFRGKLVPGRPKTAGMIFLNDEGEENGGLIYGGKSVNGKVQAFGHLSFDQYNQDQVINLEYGEENGMRRQGLEINDQPEVALADLVPKYDAVKAMPAGPARDSAMRALPRSMQRVYLGREVDKSAIVRLSDRASRPRLRFVVDSTGVAAIEFLDATGKVTRRLTGSE